MTIEKDFSNSSLSIKIGRNRSIEFSVSNCIDSIRDYLALHGAIQMTAAAANKIKESEWAYIYAKDAIAYIYEQYPAPLLIKTPRNLIIEALARIKAYSILEATEIWNQLSQEQRTKLVVNEKIKNQIIVIKGERAVRYLKQLDSDEANGTRRKLYEHNFDFEKNKAHMLFINGLQLEIDLTLVKDVNALALYGAEQKISDSYSGIKNDSEKIAKAEKVIHNLYAGIWSSRAVSKESSENGTLITNKVAKQLVEWMRWPFSATLLAVEHVDEQDKLKLISNEAKVLLNHFSIKLGLDKDPRKYNQREIADLLDDVIYRLIPAHN